MVSHVETLSYCSLLRNVCFLERYCRLFFFLTSDAELEVNQMQVKKGHNNQALEMLKIGKEYKNQIFFFCRELMERIQSKMLT